MAAPQVTPCRATCPACSAELTRAVLSSVSQMFTPQCKVLRRTFSLHGLALAQAKPRMLVVTCPDAVEPVPLEGLVPLGAVEVAAYDAGRPRAAAPGPGVEPPAGEAGPAVGHGRSAAGTRVAPLKARNARRPG